MRKLNYGLTLICLLQLASCASVQPSPEVIIINNGCPSVTKCQLPQTNPQTNGDLLRDIELIESAWHDCAAQVDMISTCQEKLKAAQNTIPGQSNE